MPRHLLRDQVNLNHGRYGMKERGKVNDIRESWGKRDESHDNKIIHN